MLTKNERMEKMNNAGIGTGKFFTLNVAENIPAGTKIHVMIDGEGNYIPVCGGNDAIANQIIADGYVRNTRLFRRFVMAQMFRALNSEHKYWEKNGYNNYIKKHYSFQYTFDMMLEEITVLSKLEVRDFESFVERSHFFTKDVVVKVMNDYIVEFKAYVNGLQTKHCKGIPYKTIKGNDIFVADLDKKVYKPLEYIIGAMKRANSYEEMRKILVKFKRQMIKLPYETEKSKAWFDAYKGEGAFYTLKNLIMYHDCYIISDRAEKLTGYKAVCFLNSKLDEYQGEGWRMFALMKKVIEDNKFDFNKRMKEIYGE